MLSRTWNNGEFAGGYSQFHEELSRNMPDYQKPDFYRVGRRDAAFEAQRPFADLDEQLTSG